MILGYLRALHWYP